MAGMYPDNQSIEVFGETVSWPGVDKDGKFTNGSFSDPAVRPSFIPAETLNLILDNLSKLLVSLGKIPNNTDPNQLKEAITEVLALKADEEYLVAESQARQQGDIETLAEAKAHADTKAPINTTLANPSLDNATPAAVSTPTLITSLLQTIWNKLRYLYNKPGIAAVNTSVQAVATLVPSECDPNNKILTIPRGVTKRYLHNIRIFNGYGVPGATSPYFIANVVMLLNTATEINTLTQLKNAFDNYMAGKQNQSVAASGIATTIDNTSVRSVIHSLDASMNLNCGLAGSGYHDQGFISLGSILVLSVFDIVIDLME
ncbi:MAG: hypothetical protein LBH20_08485 [Treponema sp.]|jgi:hypothetical protein|nr:hypothetical protein [Treponema sp.]